MNRLFKTTLCSGVALAAMAASVPAISQEITSTIRGTVTTPAGNPAAGLTVVVTDTRTNSRQTTTTSANGTFSVRSLTVGGPYTIRVSGGQYEDQLITDINTSLSGTSSFNITLTEAQADIEEIVIVASAASVTNLAIGPGTAFNLTDIETAPSVSRQIRDIIRVDPRVNIGRGSGGQGFGISCLGGSNRVNSFTIDGVRAADPFGLNSSGNLARNTFPIPFDTINATSVEFSPVDVEYGQFTGCNINVVTKSGTNEFTGSAFLLYTGDGLTGSNIEGQNPIDADFDNYDWGAEIGGPIIKDKLFFYGSYEETSSGGIENDGPTGAGFLDDNNGTNITLQEAERIRSILIAQYGRDPGELVRTLPQTSRRFFGRLDWQINDDHRMEASYSRLEENQLLGDDRDSGRGQVTFADNFQDRGSISDTYAVRLFSNWSDNFSTEIRASRNTVSDIQSPTLGGEAQDAEPRPRIAIGPFGNEFFGQNFASGPGVFRSANQLDTEIDQIKLKADYVTGNHTITAGYELDSLDVFNLFIINATGTVFFSDTDALEAGTARLITGNGSFTGDPTDSAAIFKRNIHSIYIQDEWQATDNLNIVAGLRYDFYKSGDAPIANPVFQNRFGFSNTQAYDGLDVFQPRIGFSWSLPEDTYGDTTITGGFARFSGGDPTVWFGNSFQNFGGAIGFGNATAGDTGICTGDELNVLAGGSFSGIPACVFAEQQAQANANLGAVAATDPNFKPPSQDRFSLGIAHYTADTGIDFFDDWQVNLDFIYGKNRNAVDFLDLSIAATGELAPDGRPIYTNIDPLAAGCNATLSDDLRSYSGYTSACDGRIGQNILLTNAADGANGDNYSFSAQFSKNFDFTDTASMSFRAGYAYADANVGNPGTSSTAGSNFEEVGTSDFNNVPVGNSTFTNMHNIVVSTTFREDFFEDLTSSLSFFFRANSGRPLSFVFDARTSRDTFGDSDDEARSLLYIPTGPSDPLVNLDAIDSTAFFNFLDENDLTQFGGQIVPRTTFTQPWNADLDIRFQQELPGFGLTDKDEILLFIDFENFLNFIDSGAGVKRFTNTSNTGEGIDVVAASIENGQYVYSNFNANAVSPTIDAGDTLWRIQVGIKYKF